MYRVTLFDVSGKSSKDTLLTLINPSLLLSSDKMQKSCNIFTSSTLILSLLYKVVQQKIANITLQFIPFPLQLTSEFNSEKILKIIIAGQYLLKSS